MAAAFRTIATSVTETELSGVARPPGFKGTAPRVGAAAAWSWWAVFTDADGAALAGGSVTVQWYAVAFDGTAITTPEVAAAVVVDALVTKEVRVGAGLWPWPRITANTPPGAGDPTHVNLYLVETLAGGADTDAVAAAVVAALTIPSAAEIATAVDAQGGAAAAIAAANLPDASDIETACEGAIDAKLAAIAGAVAAAVPDVADLEGVVNPGVAPVELGPFVGSTSYELVAAVPGNRIHVYGMFVNSGIKGCNLQPRSGATDLGGPIGIIVDDRLELVPGAFTPYVTASGEAFNISIGDAVPSLTITIWYEVKPA